MEKNYQIMMIFYIRSKISSIVGNNNAMNLFIFTYKSIENDLRSNEEVIIIEDDILNYYQHRGELSISEIIKIKQQDAECIVLFSLNPDITKQLLSINNTFTEYIDNRGSTGCYYLTRKGVKKLYEKYIKNNRIDFTNIKTPGEGGVSKSGGNLIFTQLKTYHYTIPLFINNCQESLIHDTHLNLHKKNTDIIKEYKNY